MDCLSDNDCFTNTGDVVGCFAALSGGFYGRTAAGLRCAVR